MTSLTYPFQIEIGIVEFEVRRSPHLVRRLYSQLQSMNWADGRMGETEGIDRGELVALGSGKKRRSQDDLHSMDQAGVDRCGDWLCNGPRPDPLLIQLSLRCRARHAVDAAEGI